MVNFAYAAPRLPPPAPVQLWNRMRLTWVGWDGSEWELSNWRSGVFVTQGGIEGLGRPVHTDWIAPQSPAMHGQEYTGHLVQPRDVFWPVYLFSDESSEAWQRLDSAFWHTMNPGRPGRWKVATSAGERFLDCRYKSGGEAAYERDPHAFGWARYGISLVADDPFWKGEPRTNSWQDSTDGRDFWGGPNDPYVYWINSGSTLGTADMDNPGDVEAWPIWEVRGPASNIVLGVNGRRVTYPGSVAEGQMLTINSDPLDQTALLGGVDVTDALGGYDFAPIPPGESVRLDISMQGLGAVSATITPRYDRAWSPS